MIRLLNLDIQNFFSHRNSTLDFQQKSGLVLIEGINADGRYDSNGSGKSTILEGIVYALSGNTLRNVGVNDMINRSAGKDTYASIRFSSDKIYDVKRYRKDTKNGDKLEVATAGESLSKRLNKDTQSMLDSIVDIPYNVLINTIVLGEGLSSRFTQLNDADKKSLIESTLNISYDLNKSRDAANSKLKALRLDQSNLEGQKSTYQKMLSEDIDTIKDKLVDLKSRKGEISGEYSSLCAEKDDLDSQKKSIYPKLELLREKIQEYQYLVSQQSRVDAEASHLYEEIMKVQNSETPICALCKQVLLEANSRSEVINTYRANMDKATAESKEYQDKLSTLPDISLLNTKYQELSQMSTDLDSRLYDINNKISNKISEQSSITSSIDYYSRIIEEHGAYAKSLDEVETHIVSTIREIDQYEYFYRLYSPTGLTTIILQEAITYINSRIHAYSDILLDKSYELKLVKGKISLEDSKGSTYQSMSNGEKRRLDIAIQFALHDYTSIYCGASIDSLFLDEILDTLDSTGVNNIIEVLRLKMEYCKLDRIFVISHNNALRPYFDEIITVRKDSDGNSSIVG